VEAAGGAAELQVQVQCSAMRCGQEARSLLMEAPPRLAWWVWVSAGEARVGSGRVGYVSCSADGRLLTGRGTGKRTGRAVGEEQEMLLLLLLWPDAAQ
jgi:hypothetical protein